MTIIKLLSIINDKDIEDFIRELSLAGSSFSQEAIVRYIEKYADVFNPDNLERIKRAVNGTKGYCL